MPSAAAVACFWTHVVYLYFLMELLHPSAEETVLNEELLKGPAPWCFLVPAEEQAAIEQMPACFAILAVYLYLVQTVPRPVVTKVDLNLQAPAWSSRAHLAVDRTMMANSPAAAHLTTVAIRRVRR